MNSSVQCRRQKSSVAVSAVCRSSWNSVSLNVPRGICCAVYERVAAGVAWAAARASAGGRGRTSNWHAPVSASIAAAAAPARHRR